MNSTRVLWDALPAEVRADLNTRSAKVGATAIVDHGGARWYFRRTEHGWNNLAVDRDPTGTDAASDLTPDQAKTVEAEAAARRAKVDAVLSKSQARQPKAAPEVCSVFGDHHEYFPAIGVWEGIPDMRGCPCGVMELTPPTSKPVGHSGQREQCPAHTDGKHIYRLEIGMMGPRCACGKRTSFASYVGTPVETFPNFDRSRVTGVRRELSFVCNQDLTIGERISVGDAEGVVLASTKAGQLARLLVIS